MRACTRLHLIAALTFKHVFIAAYTLRTCTRAGALPGPPNMVPAGTVVLQANAQALALEQGVLGPASPIPTQCLLLKNMFDPAECALQPRSHNWPAAPVSRGSVVLGFHAASASFHLLQAHMHVAHGCRQ